MRARATHADDTRAGVRLVDTRARSRVRFRDRSIAWRLDDDDRPTDRPTDRPGRSFVRVRGHAARRTERERRRAMTATDPTRVAGEIEGLTIKSMAKDAVRGFVSFVARSFDVERRRRRRRRERTE